MSKLIQSYTIDDVVVDYRGDMGDLQLYTSKLDEDVTLYLVTKEGEVTGKILVEADMGQGVGFILDVTIKGPR